MRWVVVLLGSWAFAGACTRDAAEALCPDIAEGALVITEVAGPQTGNDTAKPWIEVYNASSEPIDLYGIRIRFRKIDGSSETPVIVRRELVAASGAYTVLGLDDDAALASYLDYGFLSEFKTGWLTTAAVDIEACGTRIDRARYDSLPRTGTYSLGVTPPTAQDNDLPANWCTDPTVDGTGIPGTPQRTNLACP